MYASASVLVASVVAALDSHGGDGVEVWRLEIASRAEQSTLYLSLSYNYRVQGQGQALVVLLLVR